jgi:hypothetical protein
MTQHTPGPWTLGPVEPAEISKGHWITHGSYKGVIGILGGSPSEANAALIAAAPETAAERDRLRQVNEVMLEALREARGRPDLAHDGMRCAFSLENGGKPCNCWIASIEAAIAAAEGE